jgi:hypothetical protein
MLSYLLVWIVSLGSVGFYLSGFLLPEVARKYDPIWSGLGLIYALDLLADHSRIRGGLLLGQMASVALIVWFGWQTVQQRRQLTPETERTPLPNSIDGVIPFLKQGWERLQAAYGQDAPEQSSGLVSGVEPVPSAAPPVSGEKGLLAEDTASESEASTAIASEETAVAEALPDSPSATAESPIIASPPESSEAPPVSPELELSEPELSEPELPEAETTAEALETVSETQDEITEPEVSAAVSAPLEASPAAEETATVEEMPSAVNETVIASEETVEETVNDLADTATEDDAASPVSVEEPEHTPEISDSDSDHEPGFTVAEETADSDQSTDKNTNPDDGWPPPIP